MQGKITKKGKIKNPSFNIHLPFDEIHLAYRIRSLLNKGVVEKIKGVITDDRFATLGVSQIVFTTNDIEELEFIYELTCKYLQTPKKNDMMQMVRWLNSNLQRNLSINYEQIQDLESNA
jgi:hypothetical protein